MLGAVVFKYSKTTTGYHEEATTPHQATSVNVHVLFVNVCKRISYSPRLTVFILNCDDNNDHERFNLFSTMTFINEMCPVLG